MPPEDRPTAAPDLPGGQSRIEDHALLSDCHSAALVSRDGSVDWLCLPRYDSAAVFAALLGDPSHGRWQLRPADDAATSQRRYVGDSFVLETTWTTETGVLRVTDLMPTNDDRADVVRRVETLEGVVRVRQELVVRPQYGTVVPWVRRVTDPDGLDGLLAVAGPDAYLLRGGPMPTPVDHRHVGEWDLAAGERHDVSLTWYRSYRDMPRRLDVQERLTATLAWWQDWADRADPGHHHPAAVQRSLLVLRALTHADTGGIVAAATTSLPEDFGGERNWDYRYVWLRDAALTLEALLTHGYREEAEGWRRWLLRAVAGDPADVQIMYGLAGERELPERELPHLPGYAGSLPVRVGNGAVDQYQADVLGEVLVALDRARREGVAEDEFSWPLQRALLGYVEEHWDRRDHGIWEMRGDLQHFTHSRVMVWAALDRGVRAVQEGGMDGPVERWAALRDRVRAEVEEHGWDAERGTYTQVYGSTHVDASLLMLPQVGFLAADDPRMLGTVAAIEADLLRDGLVLRYDTGPGLDGLAGDEHPFLACTFWLVEQHARSGRLGDAHALMERALACSSDLGLLSEEYDTRAGRQAGNVPQALSHLALVRAADALADCTPEASR
ncbi:glycoside hydrolase family 15 protein [Pseudokineococcus lusitanus]|uniref:GH15 family glucan-1,4-alpha-glucosidase n=1 Tax=Pseudokineococcus lusitanus TaxID=763993 RepID=A0A3N1HSC5_9ACTN|nr:glycoside hydrolase family 15 protein [Pseudokineococcus lusitanus]ROP45433.1 GH15 family glucan-1,4-alpha-glucosidase [Pseudokineococcus lusitanus]